MMDNVTGIILAGGKSRRMGEDKAFLPFLERPLIETVIGKLSQFLKDLVIVTDRPHLYRRYKIKTCKDILRGRGPLGGIYTGLASSSNIYNFVVACDMPFINQNLIQYMLKKTDGRQVVIAKYNRRLQPLSAIYSKDCIKLAKKALSKNNLRLTDFLKGLKIKIIREREVKRFDASGLSFTNINTRKDYQWILENHFAE